MSDQERPIQACVAKRQEPSMPEVYMPAMWPVEFQQKALDWVKAWRWRRLYRRLLRLSDRQLRMRDLSRPLLQNKARMPLRQIVAEQRSAASRVRACER
ncbi:hypothetical protein MST27_16400 [Pseudomonas sp. PS1]|uniref:Uncharacterized protein n=1 Tax=Stutzerimonas marianensis TaxID=2929513 RepID=A0A9X1W4M2_9GAMM|nr:hypothetical protein [Pseudomonas marianensis]MCJ0974956.1 hypothetical protein [Pseudomonas marianensis]